MAWRSFPAPAAYAKAGVQIMQPDGTLRSRAGFASRLVASPSPTGFDERGRLEKSMIRVLAAATIVLGAFSSQVAAGDAPKPIPSDRFSKDKAGEILCVAEGLEIFMAMERKGQLSAKQLYFFLPGIGYFCESISPEPVALEEARRAFLKLCDGCDDLMYTDRELAKIMYDLSFDTSNAPYRELSE